MALQLSDRDPIRFDGMRIQLKQSIPRSRHRCASSAPAMATEQIPVVDLRYLSQAELNTLSLSSANAFDVRRCDDMVVPKIDRSVFNESAGSRKQTYSRIRLAQRKPDARSSPSSCRRSRPLPTSSPSPATAADDDDEPGRLENQKIVSFLTQLFSGEKPSIAATPPAPSRVQSLALVLSDRPNSSIHSEEASWSLVSVNDRDKEVLNGKDMVVDLVALGKKDNPFGEELRRRTEGMRSEAELLEFLGGVDGQWGSRRRKRKIVDAAAFGDDLPRGWKLLLGLRRKEGIVKLECRRYISPSGKQFASCKEVSSYILSVIGNQDPGQPISAENCGGVPNIYKMTPQSSAGPTSQTDATKETRSCIVVKPISSTSAGHEKQLILFNAEQIAAEPKNVLECHKCSLTFIDKDALVQHLLSFHQRSAKRRKLGKSIGDGVIVKDGKYECQFCHKTFIERHRYNGHIGAHVRYQGVSVETVPDESISGDALNPTPLATVPFPQMDVSSYRSEEACTSKSVNGHHVGSSNCRLLVESYGSYRNTGYHVSESAEVGCNKKYVEDQVNINDVVHNKSEIIETSSIMNIGYNGTSNAASLFLIDSNNSVEGSSPNFSHDVSTSKPVEDIMNDMDMNDCKSEEVEDSHVKDIRASESRNANPLVTNVDNTTCSPVNKNDLVFSMGISVDAIDGSDMINGESQGMIDMCSTIGMIPNSCLDALSPGLLNLDIMAYEASNQIDLSSCTMISDIEKYSEEPKVDSESNMLTVSANGLSCSVGTYSNDIFTGKMEGDIVQIDTSNDVLDSDVGHCHVLPNKGGVIGDTLHSELYGSQKSPVGSRHTNSVTINADSAFLNDIKVSVLDEMDKIGNELENCFHSSNTEGDARDAIENDKRSSLLVDVANAPWVQSSNSLPNLDMIPNQCEDELNDAVQELENMSGYQELMMNGTQLPEFVLLNDELGSVHKATNEFGYVAELENENCLPIEPGWGMSMPEMVNQRKVKAACVWCGNEFDIEDISAKLPSDIIRSVCPACKGNISGQANAASNGLSGENSQL